MLKKLFSTEVEVIWFKGPGSGVLLGYSYRPSTIIGGTFKGSFAALTSSFSSSTVLLG